MVRAWSLSSCCFVRQETLFQMYKWVLLIIMLAVTLGWTSIRSRGSSSIPSHVMLQKLDLSAGLMGLLAGMQTLPFYFWQPFFSTTYFFDRHGHMTLSCKGPIAMFRVMLPIDIVPTRGPLAVETKSSFVLMVGTFE